MRCAKSWTGSASRPPCCNAEWKRLISSRSAPRKPPGHFPTVDGAAALLALGCAPVLRRAELVCGTAGSAVNVGLRRGEWVGGSPVQICYPDTLELFNCRNVLIRPAAV